MIASIVFVALIGTCFAGEVRVLPCGNNIPTPLKVTVDGCEESPCKFKIGDNMLVDVEFKLPVEDRMAQLFEELGMRSSNTFICNTSQECPIPANKAVTDHREVFIDNAYAKEYSYSLRKYGGEAYFCFRVPLIVDRGF